MSQMLERRQDPDNRAVVLLIQDLADQVKELKGAVADLKRANAYTHGVTQEFLEKAVKHAMEDAFPYGDAESHRKVHEAYIKEAEDRAKLYQTLRTEVAKYGLIGLLVWAGLALWHAFLRGPT